MERRVNLARSGEEAGPCPFRKHSANKLCHIFSFHFDYQSFDENEMHENLQERLKKKNS